MDIIVCKFIQVHFSCVLKSPKHQLACNTKQGVGRHFVKCFVDNFLKYWEKFGKKLVQNIVKTT